MQIQKLSDVPEFAKATAKLMDLRKRRDDLERRYTEAIRPPVDNDEPMSRRDAAATALLEGEEPTTRIRENLSKLADERAIVQRAAEIQGRIVSDLKEKLSRDLAASKLRPAYGALVKQIAEILIELGRACEAERDFRNEVQAAGFDFPLPMMPLRESLVALTPAGNGSLVDRYPAEARKNGYIK